MAGKGAAAILSTAAAISLNTSRIYKNPKLPRGIGRASETTPGKLFLSSAKLHLPVYMLIFLGIKPILMERGLVTAWRRSKKNKDRQSNCKICSQRELGGAEVYELKGPGGTSVFDVEKAKEIVAGRQPVLVPADDLAPLLAASHYEEAHLSHVDPDNPGILGQRFSGVFLLDGVHRAARCLQQGKAFHAFVLTQEETLSCLVLQDLWESNVGMVARELRQLLEDHPDMAYLDVKLDSNPQALEQIRKLLTPEENARIRIVPPSDSSEKI